MHHAFLPGDKLDVQQLADDLGVSRTPVKDAINRLTSEGLVVLRSRRGTYVATLTPTVLWNLVATRMMIESWAVQHATVGSLHRITPEMQAVFDRSTAVITGAAAADFDYSAYFALDLQLHALLIGLTNNAVLLDLHQVILARMSVGRIYYPGEDEVLRRSYSAHAEHAAIVCAVAAGDRDTLLAAVQAHINASKEHTEWLLDRATNAENAQRERTVHVGPDAPELAVVSRVV